MKEIKCILIEDELPAREILKSYLEDVPGWKLVAEFTNAIEPIDFLSRHAIDVIFLDVQLPKLSGIGFLRTLQNPPLVIMTTAYSEHAVEAFELTVFDYLLKPYSFERLLKTIHRANQHFLQRTAPSTLSLVNHSPSETKVETITIREQREYIKIPVSEILYIESQKEYVVIVTEERNHRTRMSMQQMGDLLPEDQFLRTHRSFMVSIGKIVSFSRNQIKVGSYQIPVGRYYKKEVLARLEQDG